MSSARAHVLVFVGLAALVGAELALAYAHVSRGLTLAVLLALAALGFSCVLAFHMQLRAEPRGIKLLFVLPMFFPVVFAAALVLEAWARGHH